jgi:CubicO group peptidase (beta-lactamase class C family)
MYVSLLPRCWSGAALCLILLNPLTAQAPSALEQRIRRIEDGIIQSPILVKGEPASTVSLADRMAALHVPGVSIAVIHDGKIEWARGFGVAKIGGASLTPDTLFQAASISKPVAALAVLRLGQWNGDEPEKGGCSAKSDLGEHGSVAVIS